VARVEAYDAWYHAERQKEADRLAVDAAIREAEESDRQARLRLGAFRLGRQTGASVIAELAERIRRGELSKLGLAFLLANAGKVAMLMDVFAKNERAEEGLRSAEGTNEQTRPDLSALTTEQLIAIVNGALGPEPTSGASPSQGV
jgi:hypothetical protein